MRLRTIWTFPGLPLPERIDRTKEWGWRTLAHRLPRRLAYWSLIDSGVRAMRSDEIVPEVLYMDVLTRSEK